MIELIMLHSIIVGYLPAQPVMENFMSQTIHSYSCPLIQRTVSMLRKHNLSHCSAPSLVNDGAMKQRNEGPE